MCVEGGGGRVGDGGFRGFTPSLYGGLVLGSEALLHHCGGSWVQRSHSITMQEVVMGLEASLHYYGGGLWVQRLYSIIMAWGGGAS